MLKRLEKLESALKPKESDPFEKLTENEIDFKINEILKTGIADNLDLNDPLDSKLNYTLNQYKAGLSVL